MDLTLLAIKFMTIDIVNYKKSIYSRCTKIKDNHNFMKNFKNKVAAITGAGSGIGQQLALLLAKAGCHVSLSDVNEQGLAKTVELLQGSNVRVTTKKLDVSDRLAMQAWAEETIQNHGSVNMIFGGVSKSMLKQSRLNFDKIEKCE